MRLGGSTSTLGPLNGILQLGGWELGVFSGDVGTITMTGGEADVTNSNSTALLGIGVAGQGNFFLAGGTVIADSLQIGIAAGSTGSVSVVSNGFLRTESLSLGKNDVTHGSGKLSLNDGATLEANVILGDLNASGLITGENATLQFSTNFPAISAHTVSLTNATVSFRDISDAPTTFSNGIGIGNVQFFGPLWFELTDATNAATAQLTFQPNLPGKFAGVILGSGTNNLQADHILVGVGGTLSASNSTAVISGAFTTQGTISAFDSKLTWSNLAEFDPGSSLTGNASEFHFQGGLVVRSNQLVIPPGNLLEANVIESDSGGVFNNGGKFLFSTTTPSLVGPGIILSNGIISYEGLNDVSVDFNSSLSNLTVLGSSTLELNNSTNKAVDTYNFASGNANVFASLYLVGGNTLWQSTNLSIGSGGLLVISNTSAVIDVFGGVFDITGGGKVVNASGTGVGQAGFNSNAANFVTTISGSGSIWQNGGPFTVGQLGGNNEVFILNGGALTDTTGIVGQNYASSNNLVWVSGTGSKWQNTSSLNIGNAGDANQLVISNGGFVQDIMGTIGAGSARNLVTVYGTNSTWTNLNNLIVGNIGGSNGLVIANGGKVYSPSARINAGGDGQNYVWVTDSGSLWTNSGSIVIGGFLGTGSSLIVSNGGLVMSGSGFVGNATGGTSSNNTAIIIGSGSVWNLTGGIQVQPGDHLDILNGGLVKSPGGTIGSPVGSFVANARISGDHSLWIVTNDFKLGMECGDDHLLISNAGTLMNRDGYIGVYSAIVSNATSHLSNSVLVTGDGSTWSNRGTLYVGKGASPNAVDGCLQINAGATVTASNLFLGLGSTNNNFIIVEGRNLVVTNKAGTANANLSKGFLTLNGGQMTADQLTVTNGANAMFSFNWGMLSTKGTLFDNGFPFIVGDSTGPARLNLQNGLHEFTDGLTIALGSTLTGNGLINGSVTNFGVFNPGVVNLSNDLHLEPTSDLSFVLGGATPNAQSGYVSVAGLAELGGALRVALTNNYQPSPTNVFTLMQFGAASGSFINAINGSRVSTTDNLGSLLVNISGNFLRLSDYQTSDLDGDGINDAWALQYFGHTPLPNGFGITDKFGDKDGDGMSNYAEFIAGTDPTNPKSYFKIAAIDLSRSGAITIQFDSVFGRTYRIWYSTDLKTWIEVANPQFADLGNGVSQWTENYNGQGTETTTGRFYLLSVE